MSDIIANTYDHSLISMGNKMFVIGKRDLVYYESYDSISRKFTMFNVKPPYSNFYSFNFKVLGINNKLVYLSSIKSSKELKVYLYELVENKWMVENTLVKYNFLFFTYASFVKYPKTWNVL